MEGATAAATVTEWEQFQPSILRASEACPVIADPRNVYRPEEMKKHGFVLLALAVSTHQPHNVYITAGRADSPPGRPCFPRMIHENAPKRPLSASHAT